MKLWKKLIMIALGVVILVAAMLVRIYGLETHHQSRQSIWWPERGRNLIPPAATGITLQRDVLDHYAAYTVAESALNAFLNDRFASGGRPLDSYSERSPVDATLVGTAIGRLGWTVTEETVVYEYAASNGGMHRYFHDPTTGRTYQSSAYW